MTKALVIGLDGATWDLIKPWVDAGELPTFKKLMDNSVWGDLESTIPPWTFPAWESLCTGKNVGKLPLFTFMVKDGYRFEPYINKSTAPKRFFDILVENGRKILLVNLPNIHSAYETNGLVVAGWFCTNEQELTYPSNLLSELDELLKGQYVIDVVGTREGERFWKPERNRKDYLKQIEALLNMHTSAFNYLVRHKTWDFGFVVFVTPDRIQHVYWDRGKILLEHYRKLSLKLEELLDTVDDDAVVFLVSDHGFGPAKFIFNVNEWLMEEGYLELKARNEGKDLLLSSMNFLRKVKLFPLAKVLVSLLPLSSRILKPLTKMHLTNLQAAEIDWRNTKAFAAGMFGDIYINLEGREPSGSVKLKEYDRTRNEMIDKLQNLRQPGTSKKLSVKVFKKEDIYNSSTINDNKPDIVVLVTDDGIPSLSPAIGNRQIFTEWGGGQHRLNGCFLVHGPDIKQGVKITNAKIYDIAPTILHVFGLPIPRDMDGRVLKEIFEEGSELAKREITYQEAEAKDEKQRIKEKIKELKAFGNI